MMPIILVSQSIIDAEKYIKKLFTNGLLIKLEPETTEYSINQIRSINAETSFLHPNLRIYFLTDFDSSSNEAQNSFLKLLEEPPSNVQFVLHVTNQYGLLETIRSRSKIIKLEKETDRNYKKEIKKLIDIKKLDLKILGRSDFTVTKKEETIVLIDRLIEFLREKLTNDNNVASILNECIKIRSLVKNNNTNPQLSIDHLLIFIIKKYSMK